MPSPPASSNTVKSAMRTLDIVEYVVAHPQGPIAQDIAAALAIPVSSLSYLLATLVDQGYLLRDGRNYRPGPRLDRLRLPVIDLTLAERVEPLVRFLRTELNETSSFMIPVGWEVEALVTEASAQALRYAIDPGHRKPMHGLATGKVILATLSERELDRFFAETELTRFSDATIVDEAALRAELARVRREEIGESIEEDTRGICGLACAARLDGKVVGAFAVAVPHVRYDAALAERTRALLKRAAKALAGG